MADNDKGKGGQDGKKNSVWDKDRIKNFIADLKPNQSFVVMTIVRAEERSGYEECRQLIEIKGKFSERFMQDFWEDFCLDLEEEGEDGN